MKYTLIKLFNEDKVTAKKIQTINFGKIPEHLSAREKLWLLISGLDCIPCCNNTSCHNEVKWDKNNRQYRTFCSVKCAANDVVLQNKKKDTLIKKYGVDNPSKSDIIKERKKETNLARFGVDHFSKTDEFNNKIKATSQVKYGVAHPLKSKEVRNKISATIKEKYGVDSIFQAETVKQKIKNYYNDNHSCDNVSQRHIPTHILKILNDKHLLKNTFQTNTVYEMSKILNVDQTTIHKRLHEFGLWDIIDYSKSNLEKEMAIFLNTLNIKYLSQDRLEINPFELDFYLPEQKIAIEMNGIYWHSDKFAHKMYHYNKWKLCKDKGIHLITIFSDKWENDQNNMKYFLKSILGLKEKGVGGRKCYVAPIAGKLAKQFLNKYHLQGYVNGTHFGAFDVNDNLIGMMTFGKSRNQIFELKRFVTDHKSHPGLFSKIFKYAKAVIKFDRVVSFSDNNWFTGGMYKMNGFKQITVTKPSHRYFYQNKLHHCSNFTKTAIKRKFPDMSQQIHDGKTEFKLMDELAIPRIWDCGKIKWEWADT